MYIENLKSLDDGLRRAWLEGDWNVFEGQFFTEWNEEHHVVNPFKIPPHWYKFGGLDLGGTREHPTVMLKLAQDPETLTVYVYDETTIIGSLEVVMDEIKSFQKTDPVDIIYADPDMWKTKIKTRESDVTPGLMMLNEGMPAIPADNTRVTGWYVVKSWMHWTSQKPSKLKIFANCYETIRTIPLMMFNTKSGSNLDMMDMPNDDYADALRYALVSGIQYPTTADVTTSALSIKQEEDAKEESAMDIFCDTSNSISEHEFVKTRYKTRRRAAIWV